jgi:hypothetical protein
MGPEVGTNVGSGPPAIADFDGDGQPELATIQSNAIKVYDLDCLKMPPPPECDQATSIGIRWKKTIQDFSSWSTSLAAFDLNGDGRADAIYRDECWLRAYDGLDGRVLFAVPLTSGTAIELPTVADVDGDGHAEIIVSSDDIERGFIAPCQDDPDTGTKWVGPTKGLFVFQDPFRRWMPARPTWNQHAYHGTNVGDDLSIPIPEPPSWKASNSYRAQPSLFTPVKLPDFTAAPFQGVDPGSPDCTKAWTLRATLCNRGAVAAAAGVPGTFYASDPTAGPATPICTAHTVGALAPGQCEQVACDWASPPAQMADLWFRADDDGAKPSVLAECKAANDLARLPGATCAKTP